MSAPELPGDNRFPLTNNTPQPAPPSLACPPDKATPKGRARSFWSILSRILAVGFCFSLLLLGTILGNFSLRSVVFRDILGSFMRNPVSVILNRDPLAGYTPQQQLPQEHQHVVHILMLGIDRSYKTVRVNGYKTTVVDNSNKRSDAILVARVDFDAQTVAVLSIPRDTAVHIPGYRSMYKINAAYSFGGVPLVQNTLRETFGLSTDYFVTIDFDAFKKVVDAIGGVWVNVDKRMQYDDNYGNLHINLFPGHQRLNGEQAMGFVRMRKDSSDIVRAQRQQAFLEAVRSQTRSPATLLRIPDVLNALTSNIETNMTTAQMLTLTNFARKLPREQVQVATLPVHEGRKYVFVEHDPSVNLIRRLFYPSQEVAIQINAPTRATTRVSVSDNRRRRRRSVRRAPTTAPASAPESEEAQAPEENTADTLPESENPAPAGDTEAPATPPQAPTDNGGGMEQGDGINRADTVPQTETVRPAVRITPGKA